MGEKWTHERFWKLFENAPRVDGYTIISLPNDLSEKTKFTIRCDKNHTYSISINSFFRRNARCRSCNTGQLWNLERFLNELELLQDKDDYIFSDFNKINSCNSKFKVQHKKCGYIWLTIPANFFGSGKRCYVCNNGKKWEKERVIREFSLLEDCNNFTLILDNLDGIKNAASIISIECDTCKNIWDTNIHNFFNKGRRCPRCKSSKGEKRVELFLQKNQIKFESEKKFDTCKKINQLRFDFYLPEYNILCEFHGSQHFKKANFSNDDLKNITNFEQTQKRDAIKKQFAIDNGYRFLEISYTEINQIENILTKELNL